MSSNLITLCVNASAYCLLLLYYLRKIKKINYGIIVLSIFAISSIGSVWYYTFDVTPIYFPNVYVIPLIYLFVLVWLCTKPLLDFDLSKIKGIDDRKISSVLIGLAVFLSIFSLIPFLELIMKASTVSFGGSFLGQMYESETDRALLLFSPLGKFCFALIRHTGSIPVLILFYLLTKEQKNFILLFGVIISVLTMMLYNFLAGSRGGVIGWLCAVVFYMLLFRNSIPKNIYKRLKMFSFFAFFVVVVVFIFISFSRIGYGDSYQSSNFSADRWFAQYLGMGFLYFSDTVWNMTRFADGDQNFALIKSWLGLFSYESYNEYIHYMENYLGVKLTEFYTFIGDIYCDLGRIGTVIFSISFYFLGKMLYRNSGSYLSILKVVVLFMIFRFLCYGFAANLYRTIYVQIELVYPIIIGVILYFLNIKVKY